MSEVPSISKLGALDERTWRALGERLKELDLGNAHPWIDQSSDAQWERAWRPLRTYRLRRAPDPASLAARCFRYADPILEDEARALLGARVPLEALLGAGLLERRGGGVVCPFQLTTSEGVGLFGDFLALGGDAVMSMGVMTLDLLRASWTGRAVGSVLDLGCGSGAFALLLAECAGRAVGCDINARACTLAAYNARLNGISNAEFRCGDLFAPVAGERFDLILSQPPFLSRPASAEGAVLMWGGARGDELPLRALSEAPGHLQPGGLAMMGIEWGIFDDDPVERRVRRAAKDDDVNVLVIESEGRTPDEACVGDAVVESPELDDDYARKVVERRAHFERIGLRELRPSVVVLQKRTSGEGWTTTVRLEAFGRRPLRADGVASLLAGSELASRGARALLDARVRFPEGTAIVRRGEDVVALFPESALRADAVLPAQTAGVLEAVTTAPTVAQAAKKLAQRHRGQLPAVSASVAEVVAQALRLGLVAAKS